jgi:hypothetical protein
MNQFDLLPLEVIRHHIFPYLDYDGRNAVNQTLLPKRDYIRTQLVKDRVILVHIILVVVLIKKCMVTLENAKTIMGRARGLLKLFRTLKKYPIILRYSERLRNTVIHKCKTFMDHTSTDYNGFTNNFKFTLTALCNDVIQISNTTHPYIKTISIKIADDWSPIQKSYIAYGAGARRKKIDDV